MKGEPYTVGRQVRGRVFLWPQVVDEEFLPSPRASSQTVSSLAWGSPRAAGRPAFFGWARRTPGQCRLTP